MERDFDYWRRQHPSGMVARVSGPASLTKARVFVITLDGRETLAVFERAGEGVRLAAAADALALEWSESPRREPHRITTDEGIYECLGAGCACGSPLKRLTVSQATAMLQAAAEIPA